ncbi:MAG: hypothetical protein WDZ28_02760 [Simkaniaceae bacterium]
MSCFSVCFGGGSNPSKSSKKLESFSKISCCERFHYYKNDHSKCTALFYASVENCPCSSLDHKSTIQNEKVRLIHD